VDDPKTFSSIIRGEWLALAFMGALVALSFWPEQTRRRAAASVAAGTVISASTAPAAYYLILWYWPTFPSEGPIAWAIPAALFFWCGVLGMKLPPLMLSLVERFAKKPEANQ
jgi:Na+/proline symporter